MAPATERVFVAAPMSDFGRGVLAGPIQFFVSGEDNLRVESVNSLVGVEVEIHGRAWRSDTKTIDPFRFTHTPASDRTVRRSDFPLSAGAILNLTVFASAGAPRIGQTFVRVQLIRGLTGATIVLGTLLQGYVTSSQDLGWPGSTIQSSLEVGSGYTRFITGTQPAAGNPVCETVPTGARWELLFWRNILTSGPAAGVRRFYIWLASPAGPMVGLLPQPGVGAPNSSTMLYWVQGQSWIANADQYQQVGAMPAGVTLVAGSQILVESQLAGDQWDAPLYCVREWLEVN